MYSTLVYSLPQSRSPGGRVKTAELQWLDCSGKGEGRISGGQFAAGVMGVITLVLAIAAVANLRRRREPSTRQDQHSNCRDDQ